MELKLIEKINKLNKNQKKSNKDNHIESSDIIYSITNDNSNDDDNSEDNNDDNSEDNNDDDYDNEDDDYDNEDEIEIDSDSESNSEFMNSKIKNMFESAESTSSTIDIVNSDISDINESDITDISDKTNYKSSDHEFKYVKKNIFFIFGIIINFCIYLMKYGLLSIIYIYQYSIKIIIGFFKPISRLFSTIKLFLNKSKLPNENSNKIIGSKTKSSITSLKNPSLNKILNSKSNKYNKSNKFNKSNKYLKPIENSDTDMGLNLITTSLYSKPNNILSNEYQNKRTFYPIINSYTYSYENFKNKSIKPKKSIKPINSNKNYVNNNFDNTDLITTEYKYKKNKLINKKLINKKNKIKSIKKNELIKNKSIFVKNNSIYSDNNSSVYPNNTEIMNEIYNVVKF